MGMKPRKHPTRLGPIEKTETAQELARRMAASLCEGPATTTNPLIAEHGKTYCAATAYWLRGVRALTGDRELLPGAYWSDVLDRYVQPGDKDWVYDIARRIGCKASCPMPPKGPTERLSTE